MCETTHLWPFLSYCISLMASCRSGCTLGFHLLLFFHEAYWALCSTLPASQRYQRFRPSSKYSKGVPSGMVAKDAGRGSSAALSSCPRALLFAAMLPFRASARSSRRCSASLTCWSLISPRVLGALRMREEPVPSAAPVDRSSSSSCRRLVVLMSLGTPSGFSAPQHQRARLQLSLADQHG